MHEIIHFVKLLSELGLRPDPDSQFLHLRTLADIHCCSFMLFYLYRKEHRKVAYPAYGLGGSTKLVLWPVQGYSKYGAGITSVDTAKKTKVLEEWLSNIFI
jgi:hypothetical protein